MIDSTLGTTREIWVYLAASPLLNLTMTLVAYLIGDYLFRRSGHKAFVNPVLIAIVILVSILLATGVSYETYFQGAQFVHFLLGPATVALAIPLYRQFDRVRHSAPAILISLLAGSATALLTATFITWLFGAPRNVVASIAPKSATTPIAMGISEQIGGLPSLTAVLVILTGIIWGHVWHGYSGEGGGARCRCTGLCAGAGISRHRDGARPAGKRSRRRLLGPGDGPQWAGDFAPRSAVGAPAGAVVLALTPTQALFCYIPIEHRLAGAVKLADVEHDLGAGG